MDSVKTELEAERLRPKRLDPSHHVRSKTGNVADNFYNDGALRPPPRESLHRIGEILHEDAHFEEAYEDGSEAVFVFVIDEFCSDGVPIEIDDGPAGLPEGNATFHD